MNSNGLYVKNERNKYVVLLNGYLYVSRFNIDLDSVYDVFLTKNSKEKFVFYELDLATDISNYLGGKVFIFKEKISISEVLELV